MIISDLFIALTSLILVVVGYFIELPIWLILVVLLLRSFGTAFHHPSLMAVTPQIVPKDQLVKSAGYTQTLQSISQILSPAIAAIIYSIWELNQIIFLDVIGALIALITLWISHIPKLPPQDIASKPQVFKEAKEGFQILSSHKGLMGLVLISGLYSLALMPVSALFPLMSISYFGGTSTNASITEITFSIGLCIGSIVLNFWSGTKNKMYTIIGSFILMSFSLIASSLLPTNGFTTFTFLSFLMGVSGPFFWVMYSSLLQLNFESRYLGRIMSLSSSIMILSSPIGIFISGVYADTFGVEKWFLVAGIIMLIATLLCILIPSVRNCDDNTVTQK